MNLLLDLLDPANVPAIQSTTLLVLVTALLGNPQNARVFERIDGLLTITSLFKSRSTTRTLKLKLMEFLYFYLMPEVAMVSQPNTMVRAKRSRSLLGIGSAEGEDESVVDEDDLDKRETRSTEEKQQLLGRYLSNVEDLAQDLRESTPFGV